MFRSIIVLAVAAQISTWAAAGEVVTPEELGAGFRYNRSLFKSPHIVIRGSQRWKEGWRASAMKTAADSERLAESADLAESKRSSLRKGAKLLRESAATTKPVNVFQDYWTDWKGMHGRVPGLAPADVPDVWSFPDSAITPDSLVSEYKDQIVYSFRPQSTPRTRVWNGIRGDRERSGRVSDKPVNEIVSAFQFPPLAVQDPEWGSPSMWHPIDQFFENHEKGAIVVAQEQYQGHQVYHVRHVTLVGAPADFAKSAGKFEIGTIVEAWIDPERGFLPLKIEWHSGIYRDGTPAIVTDTPHKIVEVTEVRTIENAGFYPWKGIMRDFVDDPSLNQSGKAITVDDVLEGSAPLAPPKMLNTEVVWETLRIEPDAKISDAMYALEFPTSTNYFDETKQRVMIQGLTVEEVDRLLSPDAESESARNAQGGQPGGARSNAFWLVFINLSVLLIGLGAWFLYLRRR